VCVTVRDAACQLWVGVCAALLRGSVLLAPTKDNAACSRPAPAPGLRPVDARLAFHRGYSHTPPPPPPRSDLGTTLVNLCRIVPDGLLVFFPSYALLQVGW
jgi:hypothetical protein